ncbi:hypothetical protein Cpir12675_000413 [Ceratocystis pirilliformis]|uniref:UBR-type domain-containing protein n=1 Tax=Ceratocystis pirilliformis TaxID=259994 RepID=A0ABR3ZN13_9PEZI
MSASDDPSDGRKSQVAKRSDSISQQSDNSQTAAEFLQSQMQLEAEAREALPYSINTCTYPQGPLRQSIFSCLTCNPPPADLSIPYDGAAGICYACSVQCHGDHQLVEIFSKRNFTCDCGTDRMPSKTPCSLRKDSKTGKKGAVGDRSAEGNRYNHNFRNYFCSCRQEYDAFSQKGTMFQCLGLGTHLDGGCGEDWFHPGCLVGLGAEWYEKQTPDVATEDDVATTKTNPDQAPKSDAPPSESVPRELPAATSDDDDDEAIEDDVPMPEGFPKEDTFESLICFKCLEAHPWAKKYAGLPGFLPAVFVKPQKEDSTLETTVDEVGSGCRSDIVVVEPKKRKAEELESDSLQEEDQVKRARTVSVDHSAAESLETDAKTVEGAVSMESGLDTPTSMCKVSSITPSSEPFSLFCCPGFRDNLCPCSTCQLTLSSHPQLLKEEETYEPSISANSEAGGQSTAGSGSLYDRGESALKNMDRVRAIEGVMAYNMMKEKLKPFFEQFAGSGKAISADDIKDYFAKLRGDEQGMKDAQQAAEGSGVDRDKREEQDGF